ncbi:hypothetical protein [Metabacillus sp. 84]|uniref:hypothetical protein n=1 Tax=Metabacillus sp. 84 TaxID=3404705 RepID=UPI003CF11B7B
MLQTIYEALMADSLIKSKTENRIKFYEYPAAGDFSGAYIIVDPLDVPLPSDYADNQWLTDDYLFQIEVWSRSLEDTESIAKQIRNVMWTVLGFAQTGGGADEYDKDFGIFRDARRYRGKIYVNQ